MSDQTIKVEDYGQMLATVNDLEPVFYAEAGSYQGSYLAINADENRLFIYSDYYGSCSGCDWLEAEKDWTTEEVSFKSAVEYCDQTKPKLILPKDHIARDVLKAILNGVMDSYDRLSAEDLDAAVEAVDKHLEAKSA